MAVPRWTRYPDTDALRRSFELPSESKWVGFSSNSPTEPRFDSCRLPALPGGRLRPWRTRSGRPSSRASRAKAKARASFGQKGGKAQCQEKERLQDARPSSWASDWSLPSPQNDDMLSASAVLRAALTGSFLDLDDESLDLQISSDPPYTWSPFSSSQDENQSKCASPSEDDFHLNAHLMRFASNARGERVPLSTLQLLEAEVASQSGKGEETCSRYRLPSDRSDRLPCIEGRSKAATEISRAADGADRLPEPAMSQCRPGRKLPSYLRPRQTEAQKMPDKEGRNSSRPRKPYARKLQRAQSVS